MRMTGEERIAAPRSRVWDALNDPDILRQCIPGCQSLQQDAPDKLSAVVEVKIGPIGARFNGAVTLSDIDKPNGYTITGEGQGGMAGSAKGGAKVRLADDGAGTLLTYEVDAQVGGRLAQLGGPIIDATAKQLAGKFFRTFNEVVSGGAAQAASGTAPVAEAAPAVAAAPAAATIAPPIAAASAPPAVYQTATPPAQTGGASPWPWIIALALAVLAGFILGRSNAADWSVVAVALLAVVAAAAGFEAGRRGGGRS